MKRLFIILIACFMLSSCKVDKEGNDDHQAPVISSSSPANSDEFKVGQTVPIMMSVTDNDKIFVVHTHISDLSSGQLLKDIHRYPDQNSYSLDESFDAGAKTSYRIVVIARDNGGNESTLTLTVSAN